MSSLEEALREYRFLDERRSREALDAAGEARWAELKAFLDANYPDGPPDLETVPTDAPPAASPFGGDIPTDVLGTTPAGSDDPSRLATQVGLPAFNEQLTDPGAPSADASASHRTTVPEHDPNAPYFDPEVGLYFDPSSQLYYDPGTQQYYDPASRHWYDPATQKWYLPEEESAAPPTPEKLETFSETGDAATDLHPAYIPEAPAAAVPTAIEPEPAPPDAEAPEAGLETLEPEGEPAEDETETVVPEAEAEVAAEEPTTFVPEAGAPAPEPDPADPHSLDTGEFELPPAPSDEADAVPAEPVTPEAAPAAPEPAALETAPLGPPPDDDEVESIAEYDPDQVFEADPLPDLTSSAADFMEMAAEVNQPGEAGGDFDAEPVTEIAGIAPAEDAGDDSLQPGLSLAELATQDASAASDSGETPEEASEPTEVSDDDVFELTSSAADFMEMAAEVNADTGDAEEPDTATAVPADPLAIDDRPGADDPLELEDAPQPEVPSGPAPLEIDEGDAGEAFELTSSAADFMELAAEANTGSAETPAPDEGATVLGTLVEAPGDPAPELEIAADPPPPEIEAEEPTVAEAGLEEVEVALGDDDVEPTEIGTSDTGLFGESGAPEGEDQIDVDLSMEGLKPVEALSEDDLVFDGAPESTPAAAGPTTGLRAYESSLPRDAVTRPRPGAEPPSPPDLEDEPTRRRPAPRPLPPPGAGAASDDDLPATVAHRRPAFDLSGSSLFGDAGDHDDTYVAHEKRVAVHTLAGQVVRGRIRDLDLADDTLWVHPMVGAGQPQGLATRDLKAVFFMLGPGETPPAPVGRKALVRFEGGREIRGTTMGPQAGVPGYFVVPEDADRSKTERIFVYEHGARLTPLD